MIVVVLDMKGKEMYANREGELGDDKGKDDDDKIHPPQHGICLGLYGVGKMKGGKRKQTNKKDLHSTLVPKGCGIHVLDDE
jgi:hypothetical protein